jgi:hypothetical protein
LRFSAAICLCLFLEECCNRELRIELNYTLSLNVLSRARTAEVQRDGADFSEE